MPTLVIRHLDQERIVTFDSGSVEVGQSERCEVVVEDAKISRHHLRLSIIDGLLVARELGSRNGSRVNGWVLRDLAAVYDGDVVQLGDTEVIVVAPGLERPRPMASARAPTADDTVLGEPTAVATTAVHPAEGTGLPVTPPLVSMFLDLNRRLAGAVHVDTLLEEIVGCAMGITGADRGFLLRRDHDKLSFAVAVDAAGNRISSPSAEISRSVVGDTLKQGEAVLSGNARGDVRFEDAVSVANLSLRSVLCVPLHRGSSIAGVLYVDRDTEDAFGPQHQELLGHFADQASIALASLMMAAELKDKSEELVRTNAQVERLCRDLEEKVRIQTAELNAVREELEYTRTQDKLRYRYDEIVSTSPGMQKVLQVLDRVTDTEVPVLIEGESGTGKELIARALHYNSPRAARPFQAINCAAVSESLLESELFGVERGAFTGADRDRQGLIELSDGGTLFLDEVGEMSLAMQAKLLRVLETGEVWPVGGKQKRVVRLRLVAATNRQLRDLVEEGSFRGDLYYRLRGVSVVLPPLRERREDIPLLIDHFLQRYGSASGGRKTFTRGLINLLSTYNWPGNVRELEQEVRSLLALGDEVIAAEHASPHIRERQDSWLGSEGPQGSLREVVEVVEKRMIAEALKRHGGNRSRVAAELGLSRPGLKNKMDRYGIE